MGSKIKCSCVVCKKVITCSNIKNHHKSASCLYRKETGRDLQEVVNYSNCPYCAVEVQSMPKSVKANHIRWCEENPKHTQYLSTLSICRNRSQTTEAIAKKSQGVSAAHKRGVYKGSAKKAVQTKIKKGNLKHTPESIERCRQAAIKSHHQRKCKLTHNYTDKRGRIFKFDSTWEDVLADRLDELDVFWTRPGPVFWFDSKGIKRRYFPDFYLPAFDLYLDPKNPHAIATQQEKLEFISSFLNLEIMDSKEKCMNFTLTKST